MAVSKANLGGEEKGWQQEEMGGEEEVKRGERECWKKPQQTQWKEREKCDFFSVQLWQWDDCGCMCGCVHAYRHQWWRLCVCWAQLMPCYHLHWGIRTLHWQRINCRSDRWRSLFQWAGQGGGSAATLPEYQKEQGSGGERGVGRCSWEIRTHLVELHIPLNVRGNYNELVWKNKKTKTHL